MTYLIKKTYYNGYRCSCCDHYCDSSESVEGFDKALSFFPEYPIKQDNFLGDVYTLKDITITNNNTKNIIASLTVSWALGRGPGAYDFTHYHGHHPNLGVISVVTDRSGNIVDRQWRDILDEFDRKKIENNIMQYKEDLKKAIDNLKKSGVNVEIIYQDEI